MLYLDLSLHVVINFLAIAFIRCYISRKQGVYINDDKQRKQKSLNKDEKKKNSNLIILLIIYFVLIIIMKILKF